MGPILQATIGDERLTIIARTPELSASGAVEIDIDAQIERRKTIRGHFRLESGAELALPLAGDAAVEARFRNGIIELRAEAQGNFDLGSQGNVSLEIRDAISGKELILLTILAIGPAPRTTETKIRAAGDTRLAPSDFSA